MRKYRDGRFGAIFLFPCISVTRRIITITLFDAQHITVKTEPLVALEFLVSM